MLQCGEIVENEVKLALSWEAIDVACIRILEDLGDGHFSPKGANARRNGLDFVLLLVDDLNLKIIRRGVREWILDCCRQVRGCVKWESRVSVWRSEAELVGIF